MNSPERWIRLVDLLCKVSDRWLARYVDAIHEPCWSCGARPIDKPEEIEIQDCSD
jgi:hypothetical protein